MREFKYLGPKKLSDLEDLPSPLSIEIGCGVGLHPIQFCKDNPEINLLAIEHTRTKFNKFLGRARNHPNLQNLIPLHGNGISIVSEKIKDNSVSQYFFLYPNPNPKNKHSNLRWHRMPFMKKVIETLIPGGTIVLATNEKFYVDEAFYYFQNIWKLDLVEKKTSPFSFSPRTHFEKKYLERGEKCYHLIFRRPIFPN